MSGDPRNLHPFLARLVGDWTYEFQADAGPDTPPARLTGTERVRALGGPWVVCESAGAEPGGGSTLMTLGWDDARQRIAGSYVASMMAHLWIYDGEVDASGAAVTLATEGPSYTVEGATARYRDRIEFLDDDHRVLTSRYQEENGTWTEFMSTHYRCTR